MTATKLYVHRVIPPDFDGPVCVECKHVLVRGPGRGTRLEDYVCGAIERTVVSPAQKNPVTGEVQEAWLSWTPCRTQNENGDCKLYERKPETSVEMKPIVPSIWRRLASLIADALSTLVGGMRR